MNRLFRFVEIVGLCLVLIGLAGPVAAAIRVVEDVEFIPVAEGTEIQIRFNLPLRYVAHIPPDRGRLLQIQMRPLSAVASAELGELGERRVLSWQPTARNPLRRLTYEGENPSGPQLVLEFEQEVEFRLKNAGDPLRLVLQVLPRLVPTHPAPQRAVAVTTPPVAPSASAAPPLAETEVVPHSPVDISLPYAINLESSTRPLTTQLPADRADLQPYRLYTTLFRKGGTLWHRLRLGFFADKQTAQRVMVSLKKEFPEAWLTRTSREERADSIETALYEPAMIPGLLAAETPPVAAAVPAPTAPAQAAAPPAPAPQAVLPAERRQRLLDQAEASMVAGDYQRAALLYTALLGAEDAPTRQLAQEYLGLARDRANQLAHAKAEYEKYLSQYPEGEGAARVRQRLTALLTARSAPQAPLRKGREEVAKGWKHEAYGSISQYYYHDSLTIDGQGTQLAQSTLRNDIDINTRSRGENLDLRTTFTGGLEDDFRDGGEDDFRVSSFYFELGAKAPEMLLRLGRQSRSSGGVLGRFDGGLLRWQASEKIAANLVGGFPVQSTTDTEIDTERPLYGLSFDFGTFANRWDVNLFLINQQVSSLTDRRAVGGEVRYFEPTRSFFGLVDYDIFYDKLNTILFNGNLQLPDRSTLTLSADYRNSPVLTTSNALMGQSVTNIDDLLLTHSEAEIRQWARDRTAISQTYTLGLTRPLTDKLQLSGDFSISRFGSMPASGGIDAVEETGDMYFYSLQLIGSSLITEGDIAIIGLRYSDTNTAGTWALNLNTRYPVTRLLRLNPKLLVDYRENQGSTAGHRLRIRPSLRLEYRWKRRLYLELEGGAEWADESIAGQDISSRDTFFTLGYRLDF